eukprot:gene5930-6170_t
MLQHGVGRDEQDPAVRMTIVHTKYVCLQGYCAVSEQPQVQRQEQQPPDSSSGGSGIGSAGFDSMVASSSPSSRRVTMEQQAQQFALATAVASTSHRHTSAEQQQQQQVKLTTAASVNGGCALLGTQHAGARLSKQHKSAAAEAVHISWLIEGDSFGEAAMVAPLKPRPVTVTAGDGCVVLMVLDRATYARLQTQAQAAPASVAAVTLHALLAACCRPLLAVPPGKRNAKQVEALTELLAGFEAFSRWSGPIRARLAASVESVSLPAGSVVFEEDSRGDAMYVIMSGSCQEQAKLEAVQAALEADRQQEQLWKVALSDDGTSTAEVRKEQAIEKDALYWTAKYMSQAMACAKATDPQWGLAGGLTPLAAVFAAKWRQQMRKQHIEKSSSSSQSGANESDPADKAYQAMEDLLGKAAAKSWKAARDAATATSSPTITSAENSGCLAKQQQSPVLLTDASAHLPVGQGGPGSSNTGGYTVVGDLSTGVSTAAVGNQSTPRSGPEPFLSTATATAEQLLTVAAASRDPAESLKLQLAAVGVKNPSEVSRMLMEEVVARADLNELLSSVVEILEHKGLPKRLSKRGSLKITRELNKRMLGGASWKGCGSSRDGSTGTHHDGSGSEGHQQQTQPALKPSIPASQQVPLCQGKNSLDSRQMTGSWRCNAAHQDALHVSSSIKHTEAAPDDASDAELAPEATDVSLSGDWHTDDGCSSLDCSEPASLCASLDGRDALRGTMGKVSGERSSSADLAALGNRSLRQQCHGIGKITGSPGMLGCSILNPASLVELYGQVIRIMGPGESFGEVALLNKSATRTATVVATTAPEAATAQAAEGAQQYFTLQPDDAADVLHVGQLGSKSRNSTAELPALEGNPGAANDAGVELICVRRSCYDATVRAVQVAALECLLGFLSGVGPFTGLSRGDLTSLAVFVRPLVVGAGQPITVAGQKADALMILQEGEVKLLDTCSGSDLLGESKPEGLPHHSITDASTPSNPHSVGARSAPGRSALPPLPPSGPRRATADAVLIAAQPRYQIAQQQQQQRYSSDTGKLLATTTKGSSCAPGSSSMLDYFSSRRLSRQLSSNGGTRAAMLPPPLLLGGFKGLSASSQSEPGVVSINGIMASSGLPLLSGDRESSGRMCAVAVPPSPLILGKVLTAAAPLAVLGAGSVLGENVLGYDPEQDPLEAVAAARTRRAKATGAEVLEGLVHGATAVAVRPCRLLVLSAADLRRFGKRVRAPLALLAAERRSFLQQRRAANQVGFKRGQRGEVGSLSP